MIARDCRRRVPSLRLLLDLYHVCGKFDTSSPSEEKDGCASLSIYRMNNSSRNGGVLGRPYLKHAVAAGTLLAPLSDELIVLCWLCFLRRRIIITVADRSPKRSSSRPSRRALLSMLAQDPCNLQRIVRRCSGLLRSTEVLWRFNASVCSCTSCKFSLLFPFSQSSAIA